MRALGGIDMPSLAVDGAEHHAGAAQQALPALVETLADVRGDQAGVRLHGMPQLSAMLRRDGVLGAIPAAYLGPECRPVRAILFDKTERTNWALGWHQDRTICVAARRDVDGFGPWSIKQGLQHVEPPFALIEAMLTIRVHLDDVPESNAPLLVALGSHRFGKLRESEVETAVDRCVVHICTAHAGDIWLYATPILHASRAAASPSHRRVLQVDFSADNLPDDLAWLGV